MACGQLSWGRMPVLAPITWALTVPGHHPRRRSMIVLQLPSGASSWVAHGTILSKEPPRPQWNGITIRYYQTLSTTVSFWTQRQWHLTVFRAQKPHTRNIGPTSSGTIKYRFTLRWKTVTALGLCSTRPSAWIGVVNNGGTSGCPCGPDWHDFNMGKPGTESWSQRVTDFSGKVWLSHLRDIHVGPKAGNFLL